MKPHFSICSSKQWRSILFTPRNRRSEKSLGWHARVTGNTLPPPQHPHCTRSQTIPKLLGTDTAAPVTLHFCCTARLHMLLPGIRLLPWHFKTHRQSKAQQQHRVPVQPQLHRTRDMSCVRWSVPRGTVGGPPALHPASGFKRSTTCLKSPIIIIEKYHKPLQDLCSTSWLNHVPLPYALAGALHAGQQRGVKRQIASGQLMFLLCKLPENGIWSFSLMTRDWMTGLNLFTCCCVAPLQISLYCKGEGVLLRGKGYLC